MNWLSLLEYPRGARVSLLEVPVREQVQLRLQIPSLLGNVALRRKGAETGGPDNLRISLMKQTKAPLASKHWTLIKVSGRRTPSLGYKLCEEPHQHRL